MNFDLAAKLIELASNEQIINKEHFQKIVDNEGSFLKMVNVVPLPTIVEYRNMPLNDAGINAKIYFYHHKLDMLFSVDNAHAARYMYAIDGEKYTMFKGGKFVSHNLYTDMTVQCRQHRELSLAINLVVLTEFKPAMKKKLDYENKIKEITFKLYNEPVEVVNFLKPVLNVTVNEIEEIQLEQLIKNQIAN